MDDGGRASLGATRGNRDAHVVLRGGANGPNHGESDVAAESAQLASRGVNPRLVIDASHANCGKSHVRHATVLGDLARRIGTGERGIAGVMAESFLVEGAQKLAPGGPTGQSFTGSRSTDACMGWDTTRGLLADLAEAIRRRS